MPIRSKFELTEIFIDRGSRKNFLFVRRHFTVEYWDSLSEILWKIATKPRYRKLFCDEVSNKNFCRNASNRQTGSSGRFSSIDFLLLATTTQLFPQWLPSNFSCENTDIQCTVYNLCNFWSSNFHHISTERGWSLEDVFTWKCTCRFPKKCSKALRPVPRCRLLPLSCGVSTCLETTMLQTFFVMIEIRKNFKTSKKVNWYSRYKRSFFKTHVSQIIWKAVKRSFQQQPKS